MVSRKIVLFLVAMMIVSSFAVPSAISKIDYYAFEISLPDEVSVSPGESVTVDGGITVTGMYWLHMFGLEYAGTPYEIEFSPSFWEHVMIVRGWNPDVGVVRLPEKFEMTITVPEGAEEGNRIVVVRGQEQHSFRKVSNSTYFVLKVGETETVPHIGISDIIIPETVDDGKPFSLEFRLENVAPIDTIVTVRAVIPEEWQIDDFSKTVLVGSNSSVSENFTIIPTTESGTVSIVIEYPFQGEVINLTKTGPYLVPDGEMAEGASFGIVGRFIASITGLTVGIVDDVSGSMGERFSISILIGIIVVLIVLIAWLIKGIMGIVKVEVVPDEPEDMEDRPLPPDQVTLKEI